MAWVYRKQMVEGETAYGIIHSGSYFFAELAVYEDGVISCWNKNDLNQFLNSLERGWVVPQIPMGELGGTMFGMNHPGAYSITNLGMVENHKIDTWSCNFKRNIKSVYK